MTADGKLRIRAVLFDLDGTLADTLRDIGESVNHALASIGLPPHEIALYAAWVGDGVSMLCRRALGGQREDRLDELVRHTGEHYRQHFMDHSVLYPGVADLLDALRERAIPVGVLSNKPHEFTVAMVQALCGRWEFAAVEGCRDEALRKPDPRVARMLCTTLGAAPEETAFVGDTAVDIHTARNAGMIPVGVTWGFRDIDELREAGAKHFIDRPVELLRLLAS